MIIVKYEMSSDDTDAFALRCLFCRESGRKDSNPLMETPFNELLEKVCQTAFDEGREYQKKQKS